MSLSCILLIISTNKEYSSQEVLNALFSEDISEIDNILSLDDKYNAKYTCNVFSSISVFTDMS